MIACEKCGNIFDEKYGVCPKCGTAITSLEQQYTYNIPAQMVMPQDSGIEIKKKPNVRIITIISVSIVVLIGIVIALIMIFSQPSKESQLDEQISLGEKYLTEENYKEAIVAFKKAIEIEPNDPELYIQLADAYLGKGDTDNAIKILENGYNKTGDENIKQKLDGLKTQIEYENLMAVGEKALSEKKYDEAIENFEKAIELKETEVKPYISAADGYIGNEDSDSAKSILEKGYEKTNSAEIKRKLDELNKIIEKKKAEKAKEEAEKYKNNIIDAVLNSESEWNVPHKYSGKLSGITFADLNLDGKSEFIVNYIEPISYGVAYHGYNYYLSDNSLKRANGGISTYPITLYYDKNNKQYNFYSHYNIHNGVYGYGNYDEFVVFDGENVSSETYSSYYHDNEHDTYIYYKKPDLYSNAEEITKEDYDRLQQEYFGDYIDANVKIENISIDDWNSYSKEKKREALEKAYDAFTYDKY